MQKTNKEKKSTFPLPNVLPKQITHKQYQISVMQTRVTTEMIFWYSNPPDVFLSPWYAETSFP